MRQTLFFNLLFNLTGRKPREISLSENGLSIDKGKKPFISFKEIASAPIINKGFLYSSVKFPIYDSSPIIMHGALSASNRKFVNQVESEWQTFHLDRFKQEIDSINHALEKINVLLEPIYYPAACRVQIALEDVLSLYNSFLSKFPREVLSENHIVDFDRIISFVNEPQKIRENAVAKFVDSELSKWNEFFDTVESMPLTPEQRLSVVVDEDATLVLAGAGSGKTSVITAKAAYLVKAEIRKPSEILLLAFGKDAAKEMSERIKERCGIAVKANTFHSFAYSIIAEVEGEKPALASHANDDRAFINLIKKILEILVKSVKRIAQMIADWFIYFFVSPKNAWEFKTKHAFYTHMEKYELRTLQGEKVKSYEELIIANWLYKNGIKYEYEPVYEHPLPQTGRREYMPDFKLTESGVYIEHFGVRRKILKNGEEKLYTAPFVNREKYLEGMEWKREVHKEHETVLLETYSYERQEGRLLEALAEKLGPYVELKPRDPETIYDEIVQFGQADSFSRMIGIFLKKFKSGGYSIQECRERAKELNLGKRAEIFLNIFEAVYEEYQKQLDKRIDFEDMLLRATEYTKNGKYKSQYKHVLIDEFQDISQGQAQLVKAIKAQNHDTRIFAVGDDWQSIYRFAGSDIHYMHEFGKEFGGEYHKENDVHRVVDLGRTFRSVDKIALAAKNFVLQNPMQITKNVTTIKTAKEPVIQLIRTQDKNTEKDIEKVLDEINLKSSGKESVLLLGRYRHIEPSNLFYLRKKFSSLTIEFKTIHASKGLEADHVIILKLENGKYGFPSEVVDDSLLDIVSPEADTFENAEERRVMYVAMTRARYTLTMMMAHDNSSSFGDEIAEDPVYEIKTQEAVIGSQSYTCGECDGHLVPSKKQSGNIRFQCEHTMLCGNSMQACSKCGTDLPRCESDDSIAICSCGQQFPKCPACKDGWLVERKGRYGQFLGCVRYPDCTGKARKKSNKKIMWKKMKKN